MTTDEPRTPMWGVREAEPPADFARVAQATLRLLHQQIGFDLWMVTRIEGDDLRILDCLDFAYGLRPGQVLPWGATLDWRMVHGDGPRVAPRVADVPSYLMAGITQVLQVGSYVGVPLSAGDVVIGTLSAYDRLPHDDSLAAALPLVELTADLLATVVSLERRGVEVSRRAERAEVEAHVDQLTQLGNRLAWTKVLVEEENRCRRYGRPACVIAVDLDGLKRTNDSAGHDAGDRLLRTAALVLRRVSRVCDQVARVGGDEFALIAVEASELEGRALLDRLATAMAGAGVEASLGMAVREGHMTLEETWKAADGAMYRHKRRRLQDRVSQALVAPEVAPSVVRHLDVTDQTVSGGASLA